MSFTPMFHKHPNHESPSRQMRSLLVTSLMLAVASLTMSACAVNEDTEPGRVDTKSDDYSNGMRIDDGTNDGSYDGDSEWQDPLDTEVSPFPGDGSRGGFELVSAQIPSGCLGYKIGPRAFITTALCLEECLYETCDIGVISVSEPPVYLGLADRVVVSPLMNGQSIADGDLETGVGIVYLDRDAEEIKTWDIEPLSYNQLSLYGRSYPVMELNNALGELDFAGDDCPAATNGLLDERRSLIGLNFGRRGRCDQFLSLDYFGEFIDLALSSNYEQPQQIRPVVEEPEVEPTEDREQTWADAESEALSRAPACEDGAESYCDGEVELSCSGTTYRAMHCGRVGWTCTDNSTWGPSCQP